ncbi:MAG: hypothetical protein IT539_13090 [Bradyrhizobiaceae bacterium]|nr:hypothetical protein [Bradyrhizobiaceae bacterium]
MRKFLIGAAALAALAAAPAAANAQAATTTGVAVGAGTGFAIGGPPGAVIGGIIGGSVGAAHEPRVYGYDPVYVAPPARARVTTRTYVYPGERYCWRDAWNTYCEYR